MSRSARTIWIAAGSLCAVLLAAAIFAAVEFQRGAERRARAIATIVERNEPLHARDIVFDGPDRSDEEHAAVLRLKEILESAPDADLVLNRDTKEVDKVRAWEPARAALPMLEKFLALDPEPLLSSESDMGEQALRLPFRVGDPLRTEPLSERDRLAVELVRALNEPHWPLARTICMGSRETVEREIRALPPGEFMLDISIAGWLSASQVPLRTIPALALADDHAEALRRWMTAFHGVQRINELPYLLGYRAWSLGTARALDSLRAMLPGLPRPFDLSEVEQALRTIDAERNLLRGLVGERALVNDVFEHWRALDEAERVQRGPLSRLFRTPWMAEDHAFYLEGMAHAIRSAGLPLQDALLQRLDWERDIELYPRTAIFSRLILPSSEDLFTNRASLEATVRVAGVALLARRAGADAGLRAATAQIDPFDGRPLRARVEGKSFFVVWSIGSNLVDDGAPVSGSAEGDREPKDIAWRIRLR